MGIRLAVERDLQVINEIYNQAVEERYRTVHLLPLSYEQQTSWFRIHHPTIYPVFVSEIKQQVHGWMSLGAYRTNRQALEQVAEVSYYVDKQFRGEGIGTRLLEHVIRKAPDFGFSILIAILMGENLASIGLLKKLGFSC